MRRLPDRPAPARRRDRGPEAAGRARPPDRRAAPRTAGAFGVPWLGWTDGECRYCRSGRENLCVNARFTGRDIDGGYAELTRRRRALLPASARRPLRRAGGAVALRRPDRLPRAAARRRRSAPGPVRVRVGRAHVARWPSFRAARCSRSRATATSARRSSRAASAPTWAGGTGDSPPEELDAAIIFAPAGELVPRRIEAAGARRHRRLRRDPHERHPVVPVRGPVARALVRSVANLTRLDGHEFLELAPKVPVSTTSPPTRSRRPRQALADLRAGRFEGTAVIVP